MSADYLQRAARPDRALVHRAEAQVPMEASAGVEPDTVVGDLQQDRIFVCLEADVDTAGPGVLYRVPEGLLADPVQRLLDLDGQLRLDAGDGLDRDAMPDPDGLDVLVEGGDQALRL